MEKPEIQDDWACLQFAKLDCTNPAVVGHFLELLFRGPAFHDDIVDLTTEEQSKIHEKRLLERPWRKLESGWQGFFTPRQRMGRLLWEMLNPQDSFKEKCVWRWHYLTEDSQNCMALLPIQTKLKEILKCFIETRKISDSTGQAEWGESFYFNDDLKDYVQAQLKRVSLQLLEQDSLFKESRQRKIKDLVHNTLKYLPPISTESDRVYKGEWDGDSCFIWVQSSSGRNLLRSTASPYGAPEMLTWGYIGSGSFTSAVSILTDATDGNLGLAREYAEEFLRSTLAEIPQYGPLLLSRTQVLSWLSERSRRSIRQIEQRAKSLQENSKDHSTELQRLISITKERLKEQKFDIVPQDFEASLYVDLYQLIQNDGRVMRCTKCELPISYHNSARGNQQRARWMKGLPVYHADCYSEHRILQKRIDSRRRARRIRETDREHS